MGVYAVTGSASGMGLEVVEKLRAQGNTVIGVDIREADVVADLGPDLDRRPAQRLGMLAPDDRLVGIVVEIGQLAAPADPDRLARSQHDAQGGLQALRPAVGCSQGGSGPVVAADQRAELAAALQELGMRAGRSEVHAEAPGRDDPPGGQGPHATRS